jgi:hypothetical protein
MRDLLALTGFVALVLVGLWVARRTPSPAIPSAPSNAVRWFIVVAVGMSALAGASQRELWPFANWRLMPGVTAADVRITALVCADSAGRNMPVDHRAWAPLTEEELLSWIRGPFTRLDPSGRDSASSALLGMAESARARARLGLRADKRPSILGPLAASSHLLHPIRWTGPDDTPAEPCAALRLVERRWNVDSLAAGRDSVREITRWEYREPR